MKSRTHRLVVLAVVLISLAVLLVASAGAVLLTSEVRVIGAVLLPAAIVGSLLVLYFEWREKMRQRLLEGDDDYERAA